MNDWGYEPVISGVGRGRCLSPDLPRSSTSIAFTCNYLLRFLLAKLDGPNTVHLPIRRRTAGLGSPLPCHYLETPTNRETVSRVATLWQLLHGRLISYTHYERLERSGDHLIPYSA